MARGDIRQTITLEGGEQVRRQLQQLGEAGERAFAQLRAAVQSTNQAGGEAGLQSLANGLRSLLALDLVGFASSWGGVTAAIAGTGAAIFTLAKSASDATQEIENEARALGLAVDKFEAFRLVANAANIQQSNFQAGLERFQAALGRAEGTRAAAADAAATATATAIAQQNRLNQSLIEAGIASKEADRSYNQYIHSLESAERSIDAAARNVKSLMAAGASDDQILAAVDALDEAEQRAQDIREQQEAREEKEAAAAAKRIADQEELARSMELVGSKAATQEERVQQLAAAYLDLAPGDLTERFADFADRLNAITDESERAAVAAAVFGRGWARLDPILRKGGDRLRAEIEEMKRFTLTATRAESTMADDFSNAIAKASTALEGIKNAVGNILGQVITPILNSLAEFIADNASQIRALTQGVTEFANALGQLLLPPLRLVRDTVAALWAGLKALTEAFNSAFGPDFSLQTTAALGAFLALLLKINPTFVVITGSLTALNEIIKLVFGDESGFNAGTLIAIGLGVTALGAAIAKLAAGARALLLLFTVDTFLGAIAAMSSFFVALRAGAIAAALALGSLSVVVTEIIGALTGLVTVGYLANLAVRSIGRGQSPFEILKQDIEDAKGVFDELGNGISKLVDEITPKFRGFWGGGFKQGETEATDSAKDALEGITGQGGNFKIWDDFTKQANTAVASAQRQFLGLDATGAPIFGAAPDLTPRPPPANAPTWFQQFEQRGSAFRPISFSPDSAEEDTAASGFAAKFWDTFVAAGTKAIGTVGQLLTDIFELLDFSSFWAGFTDQAQKTVADVQLLLDDLSIEIDWSGFWDAFTQSGNEAVAGLRQQIDTLAASAAAAISSVSVGVADEFGGFAGGGLLRGPGSGTSDSILARLSTGEFVTRAHAVDVLGAGLFQAMNAWPERFRGMFDGFALGGIAGDSPFRPARSPVLSAALRGNALAKGAGVRAPLHLHFPGQSSSFKVESDEETVGRIGRAARRAGMLSTGRKPAWSR